MKVLSLNFEFYGTPKGQIHIMTESGDSHIIKFTENETAEIINMGLRFFEARQPQMAHNLANARIAALPAPMEEAAYTEVSSDDDVPF